MKRLQRPSEAGATLVVSLIMLTLITLMIMAALAIGSANFRTVTNMQFRDEAIAAANKAIDQVMSSPFALDSRRPRTIEVDLDNDGTTTTRSISTSRSASVPRLRRPPRRAASRCPRRWGPYRTGTRSGRSGRQSRRLQD